MTRRRYSTPIILLLLFVSTRIGCVLSLCDLCPDGAFMRGHFGPPAEYNDLTTDNGFTCHEMYLVAVRDDDVCQTMISENQDLCCRGQVATLSEAPSAAPSAVPTETTTEAPTASPTEEVCIPVNGLCTEGGAACCSEPEGLVCTVLPTSSGGQINRLCLRPSNRLGGRDSGSGAKQKPQYDNCTGVRCNR